MRSYSAFAVGSVSTICSAAFTQETRRRMAASTSFTWSLLSEAAGLRDGEVRRDGTGRWWAESAKDASAFFAPSPRLLVDDSSAAGAPRHRVLCRGHVFEAAGPHNAQRRAGGFPRYAAPGGWRPCTADAWLCPHAPVERPPAPTGPGPGVPARAKSWYHRVAESTATQGHPGTRHSAQQRAGPHRSALRAGRARGQQRHTSQMASMAINDLGPMLTASEVAEMLHLHVNTVKRLGDRGELPFYRVCKRGDRRFRLDDVMRFLAQNR